MRSRTRRLVCAAGFYCRALVSPIRSYRYFHFFRVCRRIKYTPRSKYAPNTQHIHGLARLPHQCLTRSELCHLAQLRELPATILDIAASRTSAAHFSSSSETCAQLATMSPGAPPRDCL